VYKLQICTLIVFNAWLHPKKLSSLVSKNWSTESTPFPQKSKPSQAHSYCKALIGSHKWPIDSSDLERRGERSQIFVAYPHNYTPTLWPRVTKFGMLTQVGQKHIFSRASSTSSSHAVGPSVPKIFRDPTCAKTVWPRVTKFGIVIHVGQEYVSMVISHIPLPRGGGPACSILGAEYVQNGLT